GLLFRVCLCLPLFPLAFASILAQDASGVGQSLAVRRKRHGPDWCTMASERTLLSRQQVPQLDLAVICAEGQQLTVAAQCRAIRCDFRGKGQLRLGEYVPKLYDAVVGAGCHDFPIGRKRYAPDLREVPITPELALGAVPKFDGSLFQAECQCLRVW